jgi:hypothetical protein
MTVQQDSKISMMLLETRQAITTMLLTLGHIHSLVNSSSKDLSLSDEDRQLALTIEEECLTIHERMRKLNALLQR